MISHTAVEALLAKHGTDREGRTKARAHLRREILARAEAEAAQAGRSYRCTAGQHRVQVGPAWDGCANDGSTCICDCHDPGATP